MNFIETFTMFIRFNVATNKTIFPSIGTINWLNAFILACLLSRSLRWNFFGDVFISFKWLRDNAIHMFFLVAKLFALTRLRTYFLISFCFSETQLELLLVSFQSFLICRFIAICSRSLNRIRLSLYFGGRCMCKIRMKELLHIVSDRLRLQHTSELVSTTFLASWYRLQFLFVRAFDSQSQ